MHKSLGTSACASPLQKFGIDEKTFEGYQGEYELALEELKAKVQSEKKKL